MDGHLYAYNQGVDDDHDNHDDDNDDNKY